MATLNTPTKDKACTRRRRLFASALALALGAGTWVVVANAAEEETLGNNLSVPAVFVPSAGSDGAPALRAGECAGAKSPTGPVSSQFPGYYLQKTEATWQADCSVASSVSVVANWGDNLTSRPVLSSQQPIRVEIALDHTPAAPMRGYVVEKLTPDIEDRLATYGTKGAATNFTTVRVFDSGARLRIERTDGPGGVVYDGPISAEINSAGALVYGYNWGVKGKNTRAVPGTYRITFTSSRATITGVDASDSAKASFTSRTSSLTVTISSSAGKKGGSGGSGGSGGGGKGGSGGGTM